MMLSTRTSMLKLGPAGTSCVAGSTRTTVLGVGSGSGACARNPPAEGIASTSAPRPPATTKSGSRRYSSPRGSRAKRAVRPRAFARGLSLGRWCMLATYAFPYPNARCRQTYRLPEADISPGARRVRA